MTGVVYEADSFGHYFADCSWTLADYISFVGCCSMGETHPRMGRHELDRPRHGHRPWLNCYD